MSNDADAACGTVREMRMLTGLAVSRGFVAGPAYLRRAIRHLLNRLDDCRLNVPAELLLYSVLVALRRPARNRRTAAG